MKTLSKLFFSGLLAVVPLVLTIYVLVWIGNLAENMFGNLLKMALPPDMYWRGMGLISGFAVIITAGVLLRAWFFKSLFHWSESIVAKLPMVRTVYSSIRDLVRFVSKPNGTNLGQVVLVSFEEKQITLLGFLTCNNVSQVNPNFPQEKVAVYIPMSYMIGGLTIMVPLKNVQPIDMPMNEAMRYALTAGMTNNTQNAVDAITKSKFE